MERRLLTSRAMDLLDAEPIPDPVLATITLAELAADLPRERLWRCGTRAIGDAELLALVIGSGMRSRPVLALAAELVQAIGGVAALSRASPQELAQVAGIGQARAARVAAAFELGRRAVELIQHRKLIGGAEDVYRCLASRLSGATQEAVFVLGVDTRNGLLDIVEVARGSLAHVEVHPREVFRPLIRMAAAGGVIAHNHPSGDATPSREDCNLTRQMRDIGRLLGIPIIDHVVIGECTYRSVAEWMGTEF